MYNKMKETNKNIDKDSILAKWLSGEISDEAFKKSVSKTDYLAYQKIKNGILAYDVIERPLEKSFADIESKIQIKNKSKIKYLYKKWAFSIAATFLLLLGVNYFFKASTTKYTTGIGEQKTIALLDGSEVILNANSTLFLNKNRDVFLNGEAFFKIKKGTSFMVKTKNGKVKVLGTKFSVASVLDYFQVNCYSGKVQVLQKNNTKILMANQSYRKINGNIAEIDQTKKHIPYWLKGETHFKSTPAKYVFKALKNQYGLKIIAKNIDDSILFTGTFPNKNKRVALDIVADALQLKYKIQNNSVTLLKK